LAKVPSESTISRTLKSRQQFQSLSIRDLKIKRTRVIKNIDLEEALVNWVLQAQHQKRKITVEAIRVQGQRFVQQFGIQNPPVFSNGWYKNASVFSNSRYESFSKRNGFQKYTQHGESGSAPVDTPEVQAAVAAIKSEITKYQLKDVYNMDETGLFYNMTPDYTIAQRRIEGSKKDKTRITIAFTCNADGSDRFKPLFIGHAAKPRCFERKTGEQHGFWYFNNKKAWMTGVYFQKYLQQFDYYVKRPVLLLIDNAPSHITEGLQLRYVKVMCLPPNTTSKYQPLDAGIIAAFKKHYRRRQISWGLDQMESGESPYKVHQLQAMRWIAGCWRNLDQSVFANCWKHTSLLDIDTSGQPSTDSTFEEDSTDAELSEDFDRFIRAANIRTAMSLDNFLNPEDEDVNVHVQLTDEEIVQSVQQVEEDEEQEEAETEAPSHHLNISVSEKVITIARTIAFIEDSPDGWKTEQQAAVQQLRRLQRDLRRQVEREEESRRRQRPLTDFFMRGN
jgi:DDE superfamily endonuclease/Tc5 transposase DNA-binding domain